jgi:hypothetical protein
VIPEFGKGTSSAAETKETIPIAQSAEEPTVVPKVPTVEPAELKLIRLKSHRWKK